MLGVINFNPLEIALSTLSSAELTILLLKIAS